MATKEHKRQAAGVIGALEGRVHSGPPIHETELRAAQEFLKLHDFSPASHYFQRLSNIETRLRTRAPAPVRAQKRNYGGEAAGYRMQVQSVFDHLILSTCYDGEFHNKRGRIKISHRFNSAGRIDFVELKFLRALYPVLNGELRKLLVIKNYQQLNKAWHDADGFVLETLPQELIFLFGDIFRCPREELFAWLINIGHGIAGDLLGALSKARALRHLEGDGLGLPSYQPEVRWVSAGQHSGPAVMHANGTLAAASTNGANDTNGQAHPQLPIHALNSDPVAVDILRTAAGLQSSVDIVDSKSVVVRYISRLE